MLKTINSENTVPLEVNQLTLVEEGADLLSYMPTRLLHLWHVLALFSEKHNLVSRHFGRFNQVVQTIFCLA